MDNQPNNEDNGGQPNDITSSNPDVIKERQDKINSENLDSQNQQQSAENIVKSNHYFLNIKSAKKHNKKFKIDHILMIIAILVNTVMAIATFYAVSESRTANEQAKSAFIKNDSMNREFFKISQQSAFAAIKSANYSDSSFKETQKEFTIGNEPILQISCSYQDYGSYCVIIKTFVNYGKMPIFVKSFGGSLILNKLNSIPKITDFKSARILSKDNIYVSYDKPAILEYDTIRGDNYKTFKTENVYFGGNAIYENVINGEIKKYTFIIEVMRNSYKYILNENKIIKK